MVLVVAAALVLVGVAVAKPWQSREAGGTNQAARGSTPPAGITATPRLTPPPLPIAWVSPDSAEVAGLAAVLASARHHDGWGVRVILDGLAAPIDPYWAGQKDVWSKAKPGGPAATLSVGQNAVRAFGVTVPDGTAPLDLRVWRLDGSVGPRWLATVPLQGRPPAAAPLLWPPLEGGSWAPNWEPGRYLLQVLTADGIVSLDAVIQGVSIPDDLRGPSPLASSAGGPATAAPAPPDAWSARGPFTLDVNGLDPGAFVVTQGAALGSAVEGTSMAPAIAASGGPPTAGIDEEAAWLDAQPTSVEQGGRGLAVGSPWLTTYQPEAVALGVIAPDGTQIDGARVVRLGPQGSGQNLSTSFVDAHPAFRDEEPGRWIVQFPTPDRLTWPPGSYGLILDLDADGVVRHATYGITLLPGPPSEPPAFLAAARDGAPYGGSWGIVTGLGGRSAGGSAARAAAVPGVVAQTPLAPAVESGRWVDAVTKCASGAIVDAAAPVIGIAHPTGLLPVNAAVSRIFTTGSIALPRPAVASSVTPGLSLIAPADGQSWEPGIYAVRLISEEDVSTLIFCLGRPQAGALSVSADDSSAAAFDAFRRRLAGE